MSIPFKSIIVVLFFSFYYLKSFSQNYKVLSSAGEYEYGITTMTKDPGKKYLLAGDTYGNIYFHDLISGAFIKKIKVHGAAVSCMQFNSTGQLLISSTNDGEIKIYDFNKERIIQAIYSPDYSGIHFVLFSIADGFVYFNGNNRLFKTRSDLTQNVVEVLHESDTLQDAVITNDRSALIYAIGGYLKVLNTRTDELSQVLNTGTSKIKKIALVNDTLLATWSEDGTIFFWLYKLGQLNPKPIYFLKAGQPATMNFSGSGKLMCTGNIGNWARVWKPMERTIIQELFSHKATVTSAVFGTNDSTLFTGSLDGKILLWSNEIPPAPIVKNEFPKENLLEDSIPVLKVKSEIDLNVPEFISGRKVTSNLKIEITSPNIDIYVYDNSFNDGDTMSLFFNGQWILNHYGVTKVKLKVNLSLIPNTNNYLVLFANNLGKTPPNTAFIEFQEGNTKKIFRLSSDLKSCSSINFFYKKLKEKPY